MRWGLSIVALILALIAIGFGSAYYVSQPATFRVAVATSDSHSRALLEAAADILNTTKASVRLRVTTTDAALAALDRHEADFAVARSVDLMKAQAQTVMILRQDAAAIMVPKASKIKTLPELVAANIGVVRESHMDGGGLVAVMSYYAVDVSKLKLVPMQASDIGAAIKDKRINAIVIAGNLRSKSLADSVTEAAKGFKGARFIDIEAADAIAKRLPEVEAIEIDKGLFGGYPPQPDDTVNTIGLSVRLVADPRLSNDRVSEFLNAFVRIKQQLIARVSGSAGLTIPDPDEETAFVLHQGVRAFNKGEIVSLLDKYSDQIYIGGLLASGFGSICAGAYSMYETRRRKSSIAEVMEIERILDDLTAARGDAELDGLDQRSEKIFRLALHKAMNGQLDPAAIAAFEMAHADIRDRLAQKRVAAAERPEPVAARVVAR